MLAGHQESIELLACGLYALHEAHQHGPEGVIGTGSRALLRLGYERLRALHGFACRVLLPKGRAEEHSALQETVGHCAVRVQQRMALGLTGQLAPKIV